MTNRSAPPFLAPPDSGGGKDMILGEKNLMDALGELSKTDLYDAVSKGIKTVQAEEKACVQCMTGN